MGRAWQQRCAASLCMALLQTGRLALAAPLAQRHLVDQARFPEAMCLDGSAASFYVRRAPEGASEQSKRSWILSMQGGGGCGISTDSHNPNNCLGRLTGALGTSVHDPLTKDLAVKEILSDDPGVNPVFHDWNVAFLRYCDGSSWIGFNDGRHANHPECDSAFRSGDECKTFHFRGHPNLLGIVGSLLEDHGMKGADQVVLHGCAAGAFGAVHMADHVRDAIPKETAVSVLADSFLTVNTEIPYGILDMAWYMEKMKERSHGHYDGGLPLSPEWNKLMTSSFDPTKFNTYDQWSSNQTVSSYCLDHSVKTIGWTRDHARHYCRNTHLGMAYSKVPLFVLQSIVSQVFSEGSAAIGHCADEATHPGCSKKQNEEAKHMVHQAQWAFETRQERHPSLPSGAFFDQCPHNCMKWNELYDDDGVSNAGRIATWLDAVRAWHASKLGKGDLSSKQEHDSMHFSLQRDEPTFPCKDCCGRPKMEL